MVAITTPVLKVFDWHAELFAVYYINPGGIPVTLNVLNNPISDLFIPTWYRSSKSQKSCNQSICPLWELQSSISEPKLACNQKKPENSNQFN